MEGKVCVDIGWGELDELDAARDDGGGRIGSVGVRELERLPSLVGGMASSEENVGGGEKGEKGEHPRRPKGANKDAKKSLPRRRASASTRIDLLYLDKFALFSFPPSGNSM